MPANQTATESSQASPPRGVWRAWLVSGVLLVGAAAVVGTIAMLPPPDDKPPPPEVVPVNVEVQPVAVTPALEDTFDLSAVIEPEAVVQVAAEVPGRIERFATRSQSLAWRGQHFPADQPVEEGQPVAAGDPIVHLNQDLYQARYDKALAQYEYDEREFRRIQDLYERGATSRVELDDARTARDISKAALDEAQRELERTTIAAPIGGILNKLPAEVGEYAAPGQPVAEIVDINRVKVAVYVPERDVYYLAVGQPADVVALNPQETHHRGIITYISEIAEPETRSTRLEITIDNHDHALRSGQIVIARLTRRVLEDIIMIPLQAVIPLEVGRVVYVVDDDGKARRREVKLGMIKGRQVRVLSGLEPGERLIVAGHRYVGPGQAVSVVADRDGP